MSFQPPWSEYRPGDLLYGLADPREELAVHFGIKEGDIFTIDQYDTFSTERPYIGLRYDPGFIAVLLIHPKYWTVLNYDLSEDSENWGAEWVKAKAYARRKCKGGLNWITQYTERRIHFMLDGLEMESVPKKNFTTMFDYRDNPEGKAPANMVWASKERSVTGEELRWVYRHRNNRRVQNQIQFWKTRRTWRTIGYGRHVPEDTLSQCPPPWSDKTQPGSVRKAWAAYMPSNMR